MSDKKDRADLCKEIGCSHAVIMQQAQAIIVLAELADALRRFMLVTDEATVGVTKYKAMGARVKLRVACGGKEPHRLDGDAGDEAMSDKYESLLRSVMIACDGSGCVNAHELRQALNAERAAVRVLSAEVDAQQAAVRVLAKELKFVRAIFDWFDDCPIRWSDAVRLDKMAEAVNANHIAAKAMREAKP